MDITFPHSTLNMHGNTSLVGVINEVLPSEPLCAPFEHPVIVVGEKMTGILCTRKHDPVVMVIRIIYCVKRDVLGHNMLMEGGGVRGQHFAPPPSTSLGTRNRNT